MTLLDELTRIAEVESVAIVTGVQAIEPKRRFFLSDGSFVDVWVPYHFHDGSASHVIPSPFPLNAREGFRAFFSFIAGRLSR